MSQQNERREIIAWMQSIEEKINTLNNRVDVYNVRLRKLEKLTKMHGGQLRILARSLNNEKDSK